MSATTNEAEKNFEQFKKDLEKKGEKQLKALYQEKNVNGSSFPAVLSAIVNGTITEQSLTNIMQKGVDEFKEKIGRGMTYSEMREMYG